MALTWCKCLQLFQIKHSRKIVIQGLRYNSSVGSEKWHLASGICVERKPVISPDLQPIEKTYGELLAKIEFENSLKSDHERRKEEDARTKKKMDSGQLTLAEMDKLAVTGQDFEDRSTAEFEKFKLAPRVTECDHKNDRTSLDRKLPNHLVLVVEQKLGKKSEWIVPQGVKEDGETLRQTAERVLKTCCGDTLKVSVLGNAPWGFYKYKYPKDLREKTGAVGVKLFFFKAELLSGQATKQSTIENYNWLSRNELEEILHPEYHKSLRQFLVDED